MPIIYDPHECKPPTTWGIKEGTLFQCDECKIIWQLKVASRSKSLWVKPRFQGRLRRKHAE